MYVPLSISAPSLLLLELSEAKTEFCPPEEAHGICFQSLFTKVLESLPSARQGSVVDSVVENTATIVGVPALQGPSQC